MNKKRSITIKDVARQAGVSVATVSRVLNRNYPVSDELSQKVYTAVKDIGYYPNIIARSLKTRYTGIIGYVVSDISNPFFMSILRGVEEVLDLRGYNLLTCSTYNIPEKERSLINQLKERNVDGIILNTTCLNDEFVAEVSNNIPIVLGNRRIKHPLFTGDFVGSDDANGINELVMHLINLGHRQIGYVNGPLHLTTAAERLSGFSQAMRTIGIEVGEDYPYGVIEDKFNFNSGYQGTKMLMNRQKTPTAIVAMNNEIALGAFTYLRSNQYRVPDDVSIAVFGEIHNKELMYVMPTISYFNLHSIGTRLGELMIERTESKEKLRNSEIRFVTSLQVGESTQHVTADFQNIE